MCIIKLEIWLSTHDAGDIVTDKDRKLAERIDKPIKKSSFKTWLLYSTDKIFLFPPQADPQAV